MVLKKETGLQKAAKLTETSPLRAPRFILQNVRGLFSWYF